MDDLGICLGEEGLLELKLCRRLLNIKPILDIPPDGTLKSKGKNSLKKNLEIMENGRAADLANQTIGINHGDDLEGAMILKEMIEEDMAY